MEKRYLVFNYCFSLIRLIRTRDLQNYWDGLNGLDLHIMYMHVGLLTYWVL